MADHQLIQKDLYSACVWCETWNLKPNAVKCCVITNKKNHITYDYTMPGESLLVVTAIKHLAVKLLTEMILILLFLKLLR